MRKFLWEAAGVGSTLALALALQGCGGRVDQVNVGSEQGPRDLAGTPGMPGTGSGKQLASPTATGSDGSQLGQEAAAIPACPMTRTDASCFNGGVGTYSSDGSLLALAGNQWHPTLEIFRAADNTEMSAFEIPPADSYFLTAISPDNSMVAASGGRDNVGPVLMVYRAADGALLADLPVRAQNSGEYVGPDFSHDGRLLVAADGNDALVIWSVPDFHRLRALSLHDKYPGGITSVRFSPDDTRLVTAGLGPLAVWNVADGALLWSQPLSTQAGSGEVTFSPNGTEVVCAGVVEYTATTVWNATTGALIQTLSDSHPTGRSGSLSFYDDDHILIADDFRGARIWARGATGLFAPSCFLSSKRNPPGCPPPNGDGTGAAVVTASRGGQHVYLVGKGAWIYEQAQ
ncbi:MAG: WD40 repeat domain-containing protein [Polyangiaceae bacterium]